MATTANRNQQVVVNLGDTQEFYNSPHFSQATLVGDTLWVSGPMGRTTEIGPNGPPPTTDEPTLDEQARLALHNLMWALEAARIAIAGIVELTAQPINLNALPRFAALRSELDRHEVPAWTAVGTTDSPMPDSIGPGIRIEVKAFAINRDKVN